MMADGAADAALVWDHGASICRRLHLPAPPSAGAASGPAPAEADETGNWLMVNDVAAAPLVHNN